LIKDILCRDLSKQRQVTTAVLGASITEDLTMHILPLGQW
jgi:hypothetical protein